MPRFFPDNDCDFYVERLRDNHHEAGREKLRKNQLLNPVECYRDPIKGDPNYSKMCTWGAGENFKLKTRFKCDKFIKSRLRRDNKMPIAGRRGLWKITQVGTAGMFNLPFHTWNLFDDWLSKSSYRK